MRVKIKKEGSLIKQDFVCEDAPVNVLKTRERKCWEELRRGFAPMHILKSN